MNRVVRIILIVIFLGYSSALWSKDYEIKSASELATLSLQPGDNVLLLEGNWLDQKLIFKGKGSKKELITLKASKAGQVILKGNSSLIIDGNWLVVEGLKFIEGFIDKGSVVSFSNTAEYCRFTNSAIIDYNHPDNTINYSWILLRGTNNRVDHCYLKGKTHLGSTLIVDLSETPNYHRIDHNYFGSRPLLGVNGAESIRIGTSKWSLYNSYTTIEENIFDHCDGEAEIVSNKSCNNTIRNNLFYESKGTITLRHGNDAKVYGNYFIGNRVSGTGGIRLIGENHLVYNNYLQGLTGTGLKAAISLMNAWENPPLHGYWQVKNSFVVANTIIDCTEAIAVGAGKNAQTLLPPTSSVIANNLLYNNVTSLNLIEEKANIKYEGNLTDFKSKDELPKGFDRTNLKLNKSEYGLYQPSPKSPAFNSFKGSYPFISSSNIGAQQADTIRSLLNCTDIGPDWISQKGSKFKIDVLSK